MNILREYLGKIKSELMIKKKLIELKRKIKKNKKNIEEIKGINKIDDINTQLDETELSLNNLEKKIKQTDAEIKGIFFNTIYNFFLYIRYILLLILFSTICALLILAVLNKTDQMEIVNKLKIIYIYMLLLSFFIALMSFHKEELFKIEKKNILKFVNKVQFYSVFLIPIYLLSIITDNNKVFYSTLFLFITICFVFLITTIYLAYYLLKEKIDKIE